MGGFFFGRTSELERLAALDREPVALIYGLPGIGKSELAYHMVGVLLALAPWRNVTVTRVIVEPHTAEIFHGYLGARLSGRGPGDLHDLVELLSRERHLVVIDDAHVAPAAVVGLIDELARQPKPASRLIVTSRTVLPTVTTPIVIKLGPLSTDETRDLAEHLAARLGVQLDGVDELVEQSGGSPFLLRHLVAGRRKGTSGSDPIHEIIALLDSETRRSLVQLAAVASCSRSHLAATRLVPDDRVFDALTEQFLIDSGPDRLIVHDLVRDAVMGTADPTVITDSRRTAAQVLWEDYERHNTPLIAVEAICLTVSAGDLEQAFARLRGAIKTIANAGLDHLLVPTLERLARGGHGEATLALARVYLRMARIDDAARAIDLLPGGFERDVSMLITRATIAERRCQLAAAKRDFTLAIDVAGPTRLRPLLQARLAIVETLAGDEAAAHVLVTEIARAEPSQQDVDRVRLRWMEGVRHALHSEWIACLGVVAEGRRLAQRSGAHDLDFLLMLLELLAASELGDVAHAEELTEQVRRARPNVHLRGRMTALFLGIAQLSCGHIDEATATLGGAFDEYERQNDELLELLAGHFLGRALLLHGDMARSIELLASVAQRAATAGCDPLIGPGQIHLARALMSVGRVADSVEIAERLRDTPRAEVAAEAHALVAYARAFGADIPDARTEIARARELIGDREPLRTDLVLDLAHIEILGGDPERARAAALSVIEDEHRRQRPYARARALFVIAVADLAAGLTDVAITALAELDQLAEKHGMAFLRNRTALLRSATSHQGGLILERVPAEQQRGYLGLLRVLGIGSDTIIVSSRSGRLHVDPTKLRCLARHHDLLVDLAGGTIFGRSGATVEGRGVACSILVALAESLEPVPAERLYQVVWGGNDYHPLRHRNTLYIALNRTRKLLERLVGDREVIGREGTGWVIVPDMDVAVARRDPRVSTVSGQRLA